ncbi:MAG TPA: hypothetical protein VKP30_01270, partial [Polyangiaceae bacterium]|nr:hypothetical protein [Polyangiaceae bacterium]
LAVATLGCASYFTLERRIAAYLPERSRRERVRNWVLAILVCGVILIASLMLGMFLPEPITTLLLLGLIGVGCWWKSRRRGRLLVAIPAESSSVIAIRAVLVGMMTLGALVTLAHRVSGS